MFVKDLLGTAGTLVRLCAECGHSDRIWALPHSRAFAEFALRAHCEQDAQGPSQTLAFRRKVVEPDYTHGLQPC